MRIRKTSQPSALPLDTAQVVDSYSTSTTDAYSCNQVNEMCDYSTTETRVGTWIDGKPVYRKVIISSSGNTGNVDIPHGISNIKRVVNVYADAKSSDNYNYFVNSSSSYAISIREVSREAVKMTFNSAFNTWEVAIIIEYTKTTD